jgi:hypothetical protein
MNPNDDSKTIPDWSGPQQRFVPSDPVVIGEQIHFAPPIQPEKPLSFDEMVKEHCEKLLAGKETGVMTEVLLKEIRDLLKVIVDIMRAERGLDNGQE